MTGILAKVCDSYAKGLTPINLIVVMRDFFHFGTATSAENVRGAKIGPGASVGEASFPPVPSMAQHSDYQPSRRRTPRRWPLLVD